MAASRHRVREDEGQLSPFFWILAGTVGLGVLVAFSADPDDPGTAEGAAARAAARRKKRMASDTPAQTTTERAAYLAARRAELTARDLETLWRMVRSENESESDPVKVEMVWAVINRAHKRGVSVRALLMPEDKPSHQIGGRPPFSTWKPTDKAGNPIPSPRDAAARAEAWVNQDPTLDGAVEWFQPGLQDKLAAQGAELRARRDKGETLNDHDTQIARYKRTAADFRADRPGKSLGQRGVLEFFRG